MLKKGVMMSLRSSEGVGGAVGQPHHHSSLVGIQSLLLQLVVATEVEGS